MCWDMSNNRGLLVMCVAGHRAVVKDTTIGWGVLFSVLVFFAGVYADGCVVDHNCAEQCASLFSGTEYHDCANQCGDPSFYPCQATGLKGRESEK